MASVKKMTIVTHDHGESQTELTVMSMCIRAPGVHVDKQIYLHV